MSRMWIRFACISVLDNSPGYKARRTPWPTRRERGFSLVALGREFRKLWTKTKMVLFPGLVKADVRGKVQLFCPSSSWISITSINSLAGSVSHLLVRSVGAYWILLLGVAAPPTHRFAHVHTHFFVHFLTRTLVLFILLRSPLVLCRPTWNGLRHASFLCRPVAPKHIMIGVSIHGADAYVWHWFLVHTRCLVVTNLKLM